MTNLNHLRPELQNVLDSFYSRTTDFKPRSREAAIHAVLRLYMELGLDEPRIVFCQSPWQMIAIKAVLQNGLTPESTGVFARRTSAVKSLWSALWPTVESQFDEADRAELAHEYQDCFQMLADIEIEALWQDLYWELVHPIQALPYLEDGLSEGLLDEAYDRIAGVRNPIDTILQRVERVLFDDLDNLIGIHRPRFRPAKPDDLRTLRLRYRFSGALSQVLFSETVMRSLDRIFARDDLAGLLAYSDFIGAHVYIEPHEKAIAKAALKLLECSHFSLLHADMVFLCTEGAECTVDGNGAFHNPSGCISARDAAGLRK